MCSLLLVSLFPSLFLIPSAVSFCIRGCTGVKVGCPQRLEIPQRAIFDQDRHFGSALSAELVFRSEVEWASEDGLAVSSDYFQSTAFRDHFLSAGGTRPPPVPVGWTPALRSVWEGLLVEERSNNTSTDSSSAADSPSLLSSTSEVAPALPMADTTLLSRYSTIQFPGLLLNTTMIIALTKENATCFTARLIHEKQQVTQGAAPLVWLYRQLVERPRLKERKAKHSPTEQDGPPSTRSTTVIIYQEDRSGVQLHSRLAVRVAMPSVLLKFLPTSPATMEEQGSASVAKVVEKDVYAVGDRLPAALEAWTNQQKQCEAADAH